MTLVCWEFRGSGQYPNTILLRSSFLIGVRDPMTYDMVFAWSLNRPSSSSLVAWSFPWCGGGVGFSVFLFQGVARLSTPGTKGGGSDLTGFFLETLEFLWWTPWLMFSGWFYRQALAIQLWASKLDKWPRTFFWGLLHETCVFRFAFSSYILECGRYLAPFVPSSKVLLFLLMWHIKWI